jgi:hypothetical protein
MKKVHLTYPADFEAAAFYALSLLGPAWERKSSYPATPPPGEIAEEVYRHNPNHPVPPTTSFTASTTATGQPGVGGRAPLRRDCARRSTCLAHAVAYFPAATACGTKPPLRMKRAWSASEAWVRRKG